MKILIDTQIILWVLTDQRKLRKHEIEVLEDPGNEIYCHPISFFEISLKYSIGKLSLKGCEPEEIPQLMEDHGYLIEEADSSLFASYHKLPLTEHKDPFDRLLIWQAISKGRHLLSRDGLMKEYLSMGLKLITK